MKHFLMYLGHLIWNMLLLRVNPRNLVLGIKDQLPLSRLVRNMKLGHVYGLFHPRSHMNENGVSKVSYNTKKTATKVAAQMSKKHDKHFSNYRCIYCGKFHLGKNRENK